MQDAPDAVQGLQGLQQPGPGPLPYEGAPPGMPMDPRYYQVQLRPGSKGIGAARARDARARLIVCNLLCADAWGSARCALATGLLHDCATAGWVLPTLRLSPATASGGGSTVRWRTLVALVGGGR